MSAGACLPRRGIADRTWHYVPALSTNIAATFAAERARLASAHLEDAYAERTAVRAAIAELCDAPPADDDIALPLPAPRPAWDFTRSPAAPKRMAGYITTDDAVALLALGCLAAAARFGGLFG
jgi:hypothetical protein